MATLVGALSLIGSVFVTPILMFALCVIFLASIGKSLGIRRLFVKLLIVVFEYGRVNIEAKRKRQAIADNEEEHVDVNTHSKPLENHAVATHYPDKHKNGYIPQQNGNNVISRDDKLILVPEPLTDENKSSDASPEDIQIEDINQCSDFELSNCIDYIKSGIESIIEDQVTSRFEAEELKNWNLLTRTNRNYEFISWKLTIIWMCGFVLRYFILFPLRVVILVFGLIYLQITQSIIYCMPEGHLRHVLSRVVYITTARIWVRSYGAMVTFHNQEYRPPSGICVANHTSVIDIMILSLDNMYSMVIWLTIATALVGYIPNGSFKQKVNRFVSIMCFEILASVLSSVITYHNQENKPTWGICVANHTSPIDVLVLMCDNCYSLIGQSHGGFLGILQRALARSSPHIWFERSEIRDRHAVAAKLKEHVSKPNNPPILIFPEGTCINNTSVMQFKKGSFEVDTVVYPVAIKYDPRFGDAFWNSSRYSMMQYLYMMMTSWAIVCEVWYLPPMYKEEGESAINFANRVKSVIAKQGGLIDLVWDGQLKRMKPKKEWRERQQEEFSKRLKLE